MKKLFFLPFVLAAGMVGIIPVAHASTCPAEYYQMSDGTYTDASGNTCTPGANTYAANASLFSTCSQGYLQYSDGSYTNSDGTPCTPGSSSGAAANAAPSAAPTQAANATTNDFTALAPIPGLTDPSTLSASGVNHNTLAVFFNDLYKYLIGLAATLAVIMIIWGGLEISTQDSVSKNKDGKERIYNAIVGLVLVLSPVLVFSIINPAILNLSLNLPALKTATGTVATGATGGTGASTSASAPTTNANGCTTHNGQYLETAVCPTQDAASSYKCANGTTPELLGCTKNVATGVCTNININCIKTTNVYYYRATHGYFIFTVAGFSYSVIPRDAPIQSAFDTGCTADGGAMTESTVLAAKLRITTSVFMPGTGCPSDAGIPDINTANQAGVLCYTEELSCQPK